MLKTSSGAVDSEQAKSIDCIFEEFELFRLGHGTVIEQRFTGLIAPPAMGLLNKTDLSSFDGLQRQGDIVELHDPGGGRGFIGIEEHAVH
jgi:hypothetical protein